MPGPPDAGAALLAAPAADGTFHLENQPGTQQRGAQHCLWCCCFPKKETGALLEAQQTCGGPRGRARSRTALDRGWDVSSWGQGQVLPSQELTAWLGALRDKETGLCHTQPAVRTLKSKQLKQSWFPVPQDKKSMCKKVLD